jgi:proteasome lid subunit RPN8/RPN11
MVTWLRQIDVAPEPLPLAAFAAERGIPASLADPLIAVRDDAWTQLLAHVASSSVEVGGVLLGSVWRDPASGQTLIDVVAASPAMGAHGSPTYFRFTPAAWDAISRERETLHPDLLTVGWYHSHPSLGVFYSGTDRAAQRAFFARPWNVGIVVDPADGAFGLFLGPDSAPLPRSHLVVYEPTPKSAPPSSLPEPDRRASLLRHPEPAGEGSRLGGAFVQDGRDPSFVRMTIDTARAPEPNQPDAPRAEMPPFTGDVIRGAASWRGLAAWALVVLFAAVAILAARARWRRERRR